MFGQRGGGRSLRAQALLIVAGVENRSVVGAGGGLPVATEAICLYARLMAHRLNGGGNDLGGRVGVVGLLTIDSANERERPGGDEDRLVPEPLNPRGGVGTDPGSGGRRPRVGRGDRQT